MEENNRNLLLVVVLSVTVLLGWQFFVAGPAMKAEQAKQAQLAREEKSQGQHIAPSVPGQASPSGHMSRAAALKSSGARVAIDTPTVDGSLLLRGARFDDLRLKKYRETVDPKSPEIVLLAPKSTDFPYYADFGWVAGGNQHVRMPDASSQWTIASGTKVSPGHDVTLEWDNGQGLTFSRQISVDDKYMFTVRDSVKNASGAAFTLY